MGLPPFLDDNDLMTCERVGFFIFFLTSLFIDNYKKALLHVAIVTFVVIYSLYVYNFLRSYWETDGEKLETTSDGQRIVFKEIELKFEKKLEIEKEKMKDERNKLMARFKEETLAVVERFKVVEEEKEVVNKEKLLKLEEKCAKLEEENINLADKLEGKREKASEDVEEKCTTLEEEKDNLANELKEEQEKVWKLVEQCTSLEKERDNLGYELQKEQGKLFVLEEQLMGITALEEERDSLAFQLEEEQGNVVELEEKCATLEEERDDLVREGEDLGNELEEEMQKALDLEEKCATLEEEKDNLVKELEEEREVIEPSRIASEQLKELAEMLRKGLLYISDKNDEQVKTLEMTNKKLREVISDRRNKISKLEKKCRKLEEEKKVSEAGMVNSLVVINSQESVIETYKDMLNKEECLMKLFGGNNAKPAIAIQSDLVSQVKGLLDGTKED